MSDVPAAPAGWFPDPSGMPQLRYWDGAVWTHHVAPVPGAQAPAAAPSEPAPAAQHPSAFEAGAQTSNAHAPAAAPAHAGGHDPAAHYAGAPTTPAPARKTMTRATLIVLATTLVVTGGGIGALGWGYASASAAITSEAPDVVSGFLAAATTDDPAWVDYASPGLVAASGPATPLYGDAMAAEELGLSVTYELGDVFYGSGGWAGEETPGQTDSAKAFVDLTYTFSVLDVEQTATVTQEVWLTRPYYYGDDVPSRVREDAEATAVGPWRVTGFAPADDYETEVTQSTTYTDPSRGEYCYVPAFDSLVVMSELARTSGELATGCLGPQEGTWVADDVDLEALSASFPVLSDAAPLRDQMGWFNVGEIPSPLEQYRLTAGDTDYIFVIASTGENGALHDGSEPRLILIEIAETP